MAGPVIPQLAEKLRMLVTHGYYSDMQALSEAFGRKQATLRWWGSGDAARAPGTVPADTAAKLLDVFAAALPHLSAEQVRQALFGPAGDLGMLLAGGRLPLLSELLAREADRASGSLFVRDDGLSMVRTRGAARAGPDYQVALGQDFRIAFPSKARGRYLAAFQSGPGGWGVLPIGFHPTSRHLLLPGIDQQGEPDWMFEENELGLHTFVAAQASRPFPAELAAAASDRLSLDRSLIAHFVRNFEAQDKSTRRLFALDLEVIKPNGGGAADGRA